MIGLLGVHGQSMPGTLGQHLTITGTAGSLLLKQIHTGHPYHLTCSSNTSSCQICSQCSTRMQYRSFCQLSTDKWKSIIRRIVQGIKTFNHLTTNPMQQLATENEKYPTKCKIVLPVTKMMSLINPNVLMNKPRAHLFHTSMNMPGTLPLIQPPKQPSC